MELQLIIAPTIAEMERKIQDWLIEMKQEATRSLEENTDVPTIDRYTTKRNVIDFITIHHTFQMAEQVQTQQSMADFRQVKVEIRIGMFIFYTLK